MKLICYPIVDVSLKMYMAGTLWKWTNYFSGKHLFDYTCTFKQRIYH